MKNQILFHTGNNLVKYIKERMVNTMLNLKNLIIANSNELHSTINIITSSNEPINDITGQKLPFTYTCYMRIAHLYVT